MTYLTKICRQMSNIGSKLANDTSLESAWAPLSNAVRYGFQFAKYETRHSTFSSPSNQLVTKPIASPVSTARPNSDYSASFLPCSMTSLAHGATSAYSASLPPE